ncbi:protein kilB [Streptomyces niveiscabiei]|uniref:hypothetical protein n=1 Tax=Streptomyces niveiscabiei TaxID=164115 RepID=UPI0006EB3F70|nr:hypothetical protein [Streptomyces niveiscabiei]
MITTIVAVAGTLAGSLLTGLLQYAVQRATRREDAAAISISDGLAAIEELVQALEDHRRAMWVREELRLADQDWSQAREESHRTRSAITGPLLRVQLLLPDLAPTAKAAAQAAYNMREADGPGVLDCARQVAALKSEELVEAAGRIISPR